MDHRTHPVRMRTVIHFVEMGDSNPSEYNSPGFAKDGITEHGYIAYLLSTYWDFPQYNSIYPGNRYHF